MNRSIKDVVPENRIVKIGTELKHKGEFIPVFGIDEMDELAPDPHWEKENPALTSKLEQNLKEKLTDDSKAQVLIDNYGELLEKGLCERNYGYEEYIKLNRYEKLDQPRRPSTMFEELLQLKEQNEKLKKLLSKMIYVLSDPATTNIDKIKSCFGYDLDELLGEDWREKYAGL